LVDDDEAYYDALSPLQNHPETNKEKGGSLKIIYSPLHGCGIMTVPEGLRRWGFTSLSLVEKQADPNGSFPGARSPNPEQPAALKLGSAQLLKEKGDLFIATDPDADRMGVVVNHRGKAISLNGNQIASLCLFYLCNRPSLPENSAAVTTIVTTELFRKIAQAHNVTCFEVLTGFKYIGEKIHEWEHSHAHTFLFGAEESLGFLYGTHARDKDATIAACLIAEIALQLKKERKTLVDLSEELLKRFGPFLERQLSVPFGGGEKGMVTMKNIMEDLRKSPPSEIDGEKVIETEDYLTGRTREPLPRSNVFVLRMEDQTKFVIRPSGTEPKIKIYGLARYRDEAKLTAALSSIEKFLKRESP
ncbi:MAG: phospho-sugar mutase, partial [Chlamydiia bacterium]|nr:phospho-sugar mutase [Chlamydiia bacterium]